MKNTQGEVINSESAASSTESIAVEVLLRSLEQSAAPLTARQLRDRLTGPYKLPLETIERLLEQQVQGDRLFAYPGTGASGRPRYWTRGIEQLARESILRLLDTRSLTLSELVRRLRTSLRGMDEATQRRLVSRMARNGELREWPPVLGSRTVRYSVLAPEPGLYLRDAIEKIARKLALAPHDLVAPIQSLLADAEFGLPVPNPDRDDKLLARMVQVKLAAARGAPLPLRELWHSVRSEGWEKSTFDRIVLDLAASYRVTLLRHDFPGMLSGAERAELVVDPQGNHFVGIALR
ncbi:MAG: hypothetical protein EBZ36_00235 [Acidobacteria bacterium]|nr:hypothetical protein [Acidobacteriota bacterium]